MSETPGGIQKKTVVINLSLISSIFLSGVIKCPRIQSRSESVSHHWDMRGRSQRILCFTASGGGYDGCNVSFTGAPPEGGVSLVAASCSYQAECPSACLSEFTPRASRAIILNGGRYNPMNMCNHVLMRQRDEGGRRE